MLCKLRKLITRIRSTSFSVKIYSETTRRLVKWGRLNILRIPINDAFVSVVPNNFTQRLRCVVHVGVWWRLAPLICALMYSVCMKSAESRAHSLGEKSAKRGSWISLEYHGTNATFESVLPNKVTQRYVLIHSSAHVATYYKC